MNFGEEVRREVLPELQRLLDQLAEAADTFQEKSSMLEVRYGTPTGDIRQVVNKYVDLIWSAYMAKFSTLMRALIASVNQGDFLIYGLVGRSTIEHAALLRYYYITEIQPVTGIATRKGSVTVDELKRLVTVLDTHLRGGFFDWESFLTKDFDSLFEKSHSRLRQVRVGKCIEAWRVDDSSIGVLYDLFCDLVHPNLGSTLLVVRVWPDGTGIGGNRGYMYGLDVFKSTIVGIAQVIQETSLLLNGLLLVRFPES